MSQKNPLSRPESSPACPSASDSAADFSAEVQSLGEENHAAARDGSPPHDSSSVDQRREASMRAIEAKRRVVARRSRAAQCPMFAYTRARTHLPTTVPGPDISLQTGDYSFFDILKICGFAARQPGRVGKVASAQQKRFSQPVREGGAGSSAFDHSPPWIRPWKLRVEAGPNRAKTPGVSWQTRNGVCQFVPKQGSQDLCRPPTALLLQTLGSGLSPSFVIFSAKAEAPA